MCVDDDMNVLYTEELIHKRKKTTTMIIPLIFFMISTVLLSIGFVYLYFLDLTLHTFLASKPL